MNMNLSSELLTDQVIYALKRDIITHQLPPGQKISESKLAEHYSFGKGPIRGALAQLINEGLVIRKPRSRHVVAPLNLATVHNTFDLENLLIPAAAKQAAGKVDPDKLWKINEVCRAGFDISNPDSVYRYILANKQFQVTIAEATRNERLTAWISQLQDAVVRIRMIVLHLEPEEHWGKWHEDIIEALRAGDGIRAEHLTKKILRSGQEYFFRLLSSSKFKDAFDTLWTAEAG